MEKGIKYQSGQNVGNCIYLKEVGAHVSAGGNKTRKALFRCICGKVFESRIVEVRRNRTTSCGCIHKKLVSTHGMYKHPLYARWLMMNHRCSSPGYILYKYYGGRGISVCKEWRESFKVFHNYVSALSGYGEVGLTLDRIDNDGNYEPGNIRWATHKEQMNNTRKQKRYA